MYFYVFCCIYHYSCTTTASRRLSCLLNSVSRLACPCTHLDVPAFTCNCMYLYYLCYLYYLYYLYYYCYYYYYYYHYYGCYYYDYCCYYYYYCYLLTLPLPSNYLIQTIWYACMHMRTCDIEQTVQLALWLLN